MNPTSWFFHAASLLAFLWFAWESLRLRRERRELMEAVLPSLCGTPSRSQLARVHGWLQGALAARFETKRLRIEGASSSTPEALPILVRLALGRPAPEDVFLRMGGAPVPAAELGAALKGRSVVLRPLVHADGAVAWSLEES